MGTGRSDCKELASAAREQYGVLADAAQEHVSVEEIVDRYPKCQVGPGWFRLRRAHADLLCAERDRHRRIPGRPLANPHVSAPLAGLWAHQKGGFYHDGRFAALLDVVNHYDGQFNLSLSNAQKNDLVEYLKGI
jgi:hypothetical protein